MNRILSIAHARPGCGKSTLAIHLAQAFAMAGEATLLLDLDPAGAATRALGASRSRSGLVPELVAGKPSATSLAVLTRSIEAGLDLIAGDLGLAELPSDGWHHEALRDAILGLSDTYRWVFVDAPSSLSSATVLAANLADSLILPTAIDEIAEPLGPHSGRDRPPHRQDVIVMMATRPDEIRSPLALRDRILARHADVCVPETYVPWDRDLVGTVSRGRTLFHDHLDGCGVRAICQLARELFTHVR